MEESIPQIPPKVFKDRLYVMLDQLAKLHENAFSKLSFRMYLLMLLENLYALREEVEYYLKESENRLLVDIDCDFSMHDIILDKRWGITSLEKSLQTPYRLRKSADKLQGSIVNFDYAEEMVNAILYESEQGEPVLTGIEPYLFKQSLVNIGAVNVVESDDVLLKLLKRCIKRLHNGITKLHESMKYTTKDKCEAFYERLFEGLGSLQTKSDVQSEYNKWKNQHSDNGQVTKERLYDHQIDIIVELFKTGILDYVDPQLSRSEQCKADGEIDFSEIDYDSEKCKKYYRLFIELFARNKVAKIKYILFQPNKHHIGRFFYENRKKLNDKEKDNFRKFIFHLACIQNDLMPPKPVAELNRDALRINLVNNEFDKLNAICKIRFMGITWLETCIEELMKTTYGTRLATAWLDSKKRSQVKAEVIGALMAVGIYPSNASMVARHISGKEDKTLAAYLGKGKKSVIVDWIRDYLNSNPPQPPEN